MGRTRSLRRRRWRQLWLGGAAAALLSAAAPAAHAQTGGDEARRIEALEAQIRTLAAEVAELKAARTAPRPQSSAAAAPASPPNPAAAVATLENGRPVLQTADKRFSASLRGVIQLDTAHYAQDAAGAPARFPARLVR